MTIDRLSDIFFYCAIIGSIIFALKTFIPFDMGTEVDGDFTSIADCDCSFNIFTIESIAAFFMCGGWLSWLGLSQFHYGAKLCCLIFAIAGTIGMLFFSYLIFQIRKLEHIPKANYQELTNKIGKAYIQFKPKSGGKIQIELNSKLETLEAINDSEDEINSFEEIKVVKVENNKIFIEKLNK